MYTHILIRYGELSIKGKNKKLFLQKLLKRLHEVFPQETGIKIETNPVRSFLTLPEDVDASEVMEKLQTVFGITSASLAVKVPTDIEAINEAAIKIVEQEMNDGETFKVNTKRAYKKFPLESLETSQAVAQAVFKNVNKDIKAEMKNPDKELLVEVRTPEESFVMLDKIPMQGGFPQGSLGKGMLMLSGGIDSPVAGYLAIKKGIEISAVHFASPPYTSPQALEKIKMIIKQLEKYQKRIKLYVVPFTEIQQEIVKSDITDRYNMIIMRRSMFRLAEGVMKRDRGLVIINGESVGQVASQTLHSMNAVHSEVDAPILQPLAMLEKNDIIDIANQIGTYETSILPYEDCCTIFVPKAPVTKPKRAVAIFEEEKINVTALEENALNNLEITKNIDISSENADLL